MLLTFAGQVARQHERGFGPARTGTLITEGMKDQGRQFPNAAAERNGRSFGFFGR